MLKMKVVSSLTSYVSLIFFAIFATAIPSHAAPGYISTVAGDGTAAYSGDSGPATSASLNYPSGVAIDPNGNIYIADTTNCIIRKVTPGGVISTVAGTPNACGNLGDNGLATLATLNGPTGVAVDSSGNIYIADTFSYRIRKVTVSTGVITTVAGVGTAGFPAYSGENGPAINATLSRTQGVTVDAVGNIYFSDFDHHSIRKVTANTGIITTVAGTGVAGYSGDNGLATSAMLNYPYGVAVDSSDNIYIADTSNLRIRKVDANTGIITTVAGTGVAGYSGDNGPATSATLKTSWGVAVDSSGNIYITDTDNRSIRKVDALSGNITTVAGTGVAGFSGDGGSATLAMLKYPYGVGVDSTGNIYIADSQNHRIRKVEAAVAPTTGTITIVKDASPDDTQPFFFTFGNSGGSFVLDDDGDNTNTYMNHTTLASLAPGYWTFTENDVTGWNLTGISCTTPTGATFGAAVVDLAGRTVTVNLAGGDNVTCKFTNTEQPTSSPDLSVTKTCAVNGVQTVLCTVTVTNNGSAESVSPITLTDIATGAPADATFNGGGGSLPISCTPGAGPVLPINCTANVSLLPTESQNAFFSFTLPQGGTFTNCATVSQGDVATPSETDTTNNTNICTTITVPPPATTPGAIIIVKNASPQGTKIFHFDGGSLGTWDLSDDPLQPLLKSKTFTVNPGAYAVSETGLTGGWSQTSATCSNGSPVSAIQVGPGDVVTCTFTNTQPDQGTLVIVKNASPQSSQVFNFTVSKVNVMLGTSVELGTIPLTDDGANPSSNSFSFSSSYNNFAVSETVPSGWTQTSATCDNGSPVDNIVVNWGDYVTCTFTNVPQPTTAGPDLSVTKTCVASGTQSVLCTVTVTNNGSAPSVSPITLTDIVTGAPSDATYIGAGGSLPISCSPGAGPVLPITCTANVSLLPTESQNAIFAFTLPQGGTFTNCATVVQGDAATPSETDTANNTNICTTITVLPPAQTTGPFCTDFEDGSASTWQVNNTLATVLSDGNNHFIQTTDQAGASSFFNASSPLTGDWAALLVNSCGSLCFDVNYLYAGDPYNGTNPPQTMTPSISIVGANGFAASFITTAPISAGSGWHSYCAPLASLNSGDPFPSNGDGHWVMAPGATYTDWNDLLNNVIRVQLPVDPTSYQHERFGYDNICIKDSGICVQPLPTATLTIVKDAVPNDAQDFAFYAFGPNSGSIMPFQLDDDAGAASENTTLSSSKTFPNLAPGGYSVMENFDNPVPVTGWDLTGIICTSSTGTPVGTVDLISHAFTVDLAAGDNVTCTFTNVPQPPPDSADLIVTKTCALDPTNGPQAVYCAVTVHNNGPLTSGSPITVTDIPFSPPPGTVFTSSSGSFSCTQAAGPVPASMVCTYNGSIGNGQDGTTYFYFNVPQGGEFANCASASQDGSVVDPNPANNTNICARVTVPPPTTGSICGIKFNDLDGNGVQNLPDETGLPNWTISLGISGIPDVITDANGNYCFNGLPPGTYTVSETLPSGSLWQQTFPANSGTHSVKLGAGLTITGQDFGNRLIPRLGSICGIKFNDLDGNGVQNLPGDVGLPNWTISLGISGIPDVATDAGGKYCFKDVPAGTYTVSEILPSGSGWQQTFPVNPGTHSVTLAAGVNITGINFGNQFFITPKLGSICGKKFNDLDGDGLQDPGEEVLPNWTISLGELAPDVLTGADGEYCFNSLPAGTYMVSEGGKPGWKQTFPGSSSPFSPVVHLVTLAAGQNIAGKDFGNRRVNADCSYLCNGDFEERQISFSQDYLKQSLVSCWQTTEPKGEIEVWQSGNGYVTSAQGNQFVEVNAHTTGTLYQNFYSGAAGPVVISFEHRGRDGYFNEMSVEIGPVGGPYAPLGTFVAPVTEWTTHAIPYVLDPGVIYQLRFISSPPPTGTLFDPAGGNLLDAVNVTCPSSICGIKFNDLNGNGMQDPGEPGLPRWQISLGITGIPDVTTDAEGKYCFNDLPTGTYNVSETPQASWHQTFPGSRAHTVALAAGVNIAGINFGNMVANYCNPVDLANNGDFEEILNEQAPTTYVQTSQNNVPSWQTTASDGRIEIWHDGYNSIPAYSGTYFAEVNATEVGTLSHTFSVAAANQQVTVSFAHRGRYAGDDVMAVSIVPPSGSGLPTISLGTYTDNNTAWRYYSVPYTIPTPGVYTLRFASISSNNGNGPSDGGNFLDAVSVTDCPPSISGIKFNDANGNGQQDPGELGIPNWHFSVGLPGIPDVTTGADGMYGFYDLPAGTYTVSEVLHAPWQQTSPSSPGTQTVTLATGQILSDLNFGNRVKPGACTGFCNGDFENAQVLSPGSAGSMGRFEQSLISCWQTTIADGKIDVWHGGTGVNMRPGFSGNQFVELPGGNAPTNYLYQDFYSGVGGPVIISFAHMQGPFSSFGTTFTNVFIGPINDDGTTIHYTTPDGSPVSLGMFPANAFPYWTTHTTAQTTLQVNQKYRLTFSSPYLRGNFIDKIRVLCSSCLGDVDGNGKVDIRDAILTLKILSNMSPAGISPDLDAVDVDGDGKIGIQETLYIFQKVGGDLR
ncbi:MAG: hypothetical protein M0P74_14775 [Syntrophales bacterium]|jgi:hypothetical protein|nr:hypothetical protein [Syntrophales bacterium]